MSRWFWFGRQRASVDWVIAGLLVLGYGSLYGQTGARTITGMGDSDELLGIGYFGGLFHPPGYPILRLILMGLASGLDPVNYVRVAQMSAGVISAGVLGGLYVTLLSVCRLLYPKVKVVYLRLAAVTGVVSLGGSMLFWLYANVLEVFGLLLLSVVILIWWGMSVYSRWRNNERVGWWRYGVWGMLGATALLSHQITLLLIPGFGWLWWKMRTHYSWVDAGLLLLGAGVTGGVLILGMYGVRTDEREYSWRIKPGIEGMRGYLGREDFAVRDETTGQVSAYVSSIEAQAVVNSWQHYLTRSLPDHWSVLALGLMLLGIVELGKLRSKLLVQVWSGWILLAVVFLVGYLSLPALNETLDYLVTSATTERMYLLGYMLLTLLVCLGSLRLMRGFESKERTKWFSSRSGLMGVVLLVLAAWDGGRNYEAVDLSEKRFVDNWAEGVLFQVPTDSMVVCFEDVDCFALLWKSLTSNSGVTVVPVTPQIRTRPVSDLVSNQKLSYPDNPFRLMEMMTEHHKAKPNSVYWSSRNEEYEYLLGVSDQVIYLVKNKQVYQLGCGLVAETREIEMGPEPDPRIFYLRYQQRLLGKQVTSPGMRGKTDQCKATAEILAEMDTCVDAGCRLLYAWRWVGQEPLSVEARLRLADNLLKLDLLPLAVREYEQVLVLEADNMTARIKLGELEAVPRLPEEL